MLCDIGLPDVDGYEVAPALRHDATLADPRLLAVSGYAQPEDLQRSSDAGFDGHIAKPADIEQLMKVIAGASTRLRP